MESRRVRTYVAPDTGDIRLFLVIAATLLAFGLVMVYSASSVTSLTHADTDYNGFYYVSRQLLFIIIGLVGGFLVYRVGYRAFAGPVGVTLSVGVIALLILVQTSFAGQDAYGATRWLRVGSFTLQPSEFAKLCVIVVGAQLLSRYVDNGHYADQQMVMHGLLLVGLPMALILLQPDKGTFVIIAVTLLAMGFMAGIPISHVLCVIGIGLLGVAALSLKDEYSRSRIMTMFDPWQDPYGDGYQLLQGFYAIGSGGIFGRGIGLGRQKYAYLPMAHNDFVFAVVGEECGIVGMVLVTAAFVALFLLGIRIASRTRDIAGQMIAVGSSSLLLVQFLVNVGGVLGLMPLSGKPVPFLSYGGSSVIATLCLVGLMASVAMTPSEPSRVR